MNEQVILPEQISDVKTKVMITQVIKRDGKRVDLDLERIAAAVFQAMSAAGEGSQQDAGNISQAVLDELLHIKNRYKSFVPNVEGIQDAVENALLHSDFVKTAKAYILYREMRTKLRNEQRQIPTHVKKLVDESKQYFSNDLSELVYVRTYASWIAAENRRETWIETVGRYMDFMEENLGDKLTQHEYSDVRLAILNQEVMPSMRLLQFAGKAARISNVFAYNCSYIAPICLRDFSEAMYVSMCGVGVGFSVESQNIQSLAQIKIQTGVTKSTHIVADSKEGWCDALLLGMEAWYEGYDLLFDYTELRPAGARLKTAGGKSSGPEPLRALLYFVRETILKRQGRRLSNLDAHDVLCKIGEVVVSGGVRRSAMISLSDLDDAAMRDAKKGHFYYTEPQRSMANNSAVYEQKPENETLLDEWLALIKSGSGERGLFNRGGLAKTLPQRRLDLFAKKDLFIDGRILGSIGTNPCGEIILQSRQFCNLTEVVAREDDTEASLSRKIKLATILATYQSTLTTFPYLSDKWRSNCEEERLLGISITGQWDCQAVRNPATLVKLREKSLSENSVYASRFGVGTSTCVTCVKPSGTVSQVVDCASGMHPRHAPYYIRRIRISATDSLFKMLRDQGIPHHPEVGQTEANATTFVFEFPVKAPINAVCKDDLSALDQLAHWKMLKEQYTEHNPSVTISVSKDEWLPVLNWLNTNWSLVGGLSFLPREEHVYQLAPYEAISEAEYNRLTQQQKAIEFSQLMLYELEDETQMRRELACAGGACELE